MGCQFNLFFADEFSPSVNSVDMEDHELWGAMEKKIAQCQEDYFLQHCLDDIADFPKDEFLSAFIEAKKCEVVEGTEAKTAFLSHFSKLRNLNKLHLSNCVTEINLKALSGLSNLQRLELSNCHSLLDLGGCEGLQKLEYLSLSECFSLQNLDGLKQLRNLQQVSLSETWSLEESEVGELRASLIDCQVTCLTTKPF